MGFYSELEQSGFQQNPNGGAFIGDPNALPANLRNSPYLNGGNVRFAQPLAGSGQGGTPGMQASPPAFLDHRGMASTAGRNQQLQNMGLLPRTPSPGYAAMTGTSGSAPLQSMASPGTTAWNGGAGGTHAPINFAGGGGVQAPIAGGGGVHFGGGRALGGPVSPGTAYMVGERGPEMFIPHGPGTIVPSARSSPSLKSSAAQSLPTRPAESRAGRRMLGPARRR